LINREEKEMKNIILAIVIAVVAAGCFTLHQAEYPQVQMSRVPEGKSISARVAGFEATLTEYIPVYGYETSYVGGGRYGRRGHRHGYITTVMTETHVPQVRATTAYLAKAQSLMEESGFLLRAEKPDYSVEVGFGGPYVNGGEITAEFMWMLCSCFSAEYSVQNWTAKLKIYDNKTGRLIFVRDYTQKYDYAAWSPLFFIGLAGTDEGTYNYMQNWCLTALTDRAIADATAFLVSHCNIR
jgi:hypothetical protein